MTRYAPLWQQASTYSAQVDRQLFAALWPSGGAVGVAPSTVANTLNMTVPAGYAAVPLSGANGVASVSLGRARKRRVGRRAGRGHERGSTR